MFNSKIKKFQTISSTSRQIISLMFGDSGTSRWRRLCHLPRSFQCFTKRHKYIFHFSYFSFWDTHILVVVIYRPGSKNLCNTFFTEFTNLLTPLATYTCHIIIVGDINIHLDRSDDNKTKKLQRLLAQNNLTQLVGEPNHQHDHTLDVVITSSNSLISNMLISLPTLSDHFTTCNQPTEKIYQVVELEHTPTSTSHLSGLTCNNLISITCRAH